MSDMDVQDIHTIPTTLWRFRIGESDWWQIYDNNKTFQDVCRMHFDYPDGHDTWVYEGQVSVRANATNEEKQATYLKYIEDRIKGLDG